ncbi:MAG: DNA polymerase III subunit delta [Lysobacteraceae bacterium]
MSYSQAQFDKHLKGDALAPVYLIAGSEDLLRIEAADALRARARALGFGEREVFDVEGQFDWSAVTASFSAMSLFASRRIIDLRLPTTRPGKDGAAVIEAYCADPPPDTLLLIVGGEWSRKHEGAWTRAVDAAGVLYPLWSLKSGELSGWLARRLAGVGLRAQPDALALLAERVEGNLLAAAQEVDKLALLATPGETPLDAPTMQALIADSARYDIFALAEAALAGDPARSLRMLAALRAEGEQVAGLLPWLSTQVQTLARVAEAIDGGQRPAQAFQQAGVWESRQALFKRALDRLGGKRCVALAAACSLVERSAKGRADGDAWIALERWLLALSGPRNAIRLLTA